jgi:transposase
MPKNNPKGTVTGHYMRFIHKTMIEMDKFPAMKGFYIIMDNAPIHTSNEIEKMIISRGYRCIYLPPYSPELNPIEQFWSVLKGKVQRTKFSDTEDLKSRIVESCGYVKLAKLMRTFNDFDILVTHMAFAA